VHERKPSQAAKRHQYDYAFVRFGQRSVESTAAAKDSSSKLAVDATSAILSGGEIQSVGRRTHVLRKKHCPDKALQKR